MCHSFFQGFSRSARFGRSARSLRALAPSLRGRRSLAPQLSLACSSLSGTLARLSLGPVSKADAQRVKSNCKNKFLDAVQRSAADSKIQTKSKAATQRSAALRM